MKVYDWDKKLIIESPFPDEFYEQYLFQADASDKENLTYEQIEKVFFLSRDDFMSGKLGFDQFSDICNVLFGMFTKIIKPGSTYKLFDALLAGAELTYYSRSTSEPGLNQLRYFLEEIHSYKKKRK